MEILRKLTIKHCGNLTVAAVKAALADKKVNDGETVPLVKIVGDSTGAKTGSTTHGTFTKLAGSFVGTNMLTGECFQSGACILPDFVGAALGAALLQGGQAVRFAFQIEARRRDSAVTGYEWVVKPLIETKPSAPLQELMALAGIEPPKAPALAAPGGDAGASNAPAASAKSAPAKTPAKGRK